MSTQVKQLLDNVNRILVSVSACGLVALFVLLSGMKVAIARTDVRLDTLERQVCEVRGEIKVHNAQLQEILVLLARITATHKPEGG